MYIQVLEPFGAFVTIEGKSEKIPFVAKIPAEKKDKYIQALEKIGAKYMVTGGRKYSKPVPDKTNNPRLVQEGANDDKGKDQAKKSSRKKS